LLLCHDQQEEGEEDEVHGQLEEGLLNEDYVVEDEVNGEAVEEAVEKAVENISLGRFWTCI
jgi:hypothetical protein